MRTFTLMMISVELLLQPHIAVTATTPSGDAENYVVVVHYYQPDVVGFDIDVSVTSLSHSYSGQFMTVNRFIMFHIPRSANGNMQRISLVYVLLWFTPSREF